MAKEAAVFLLHRWSLPNPEYYTLRYADGPQLYITEQVSTGTRSQVSSPRQWCRWPSGGFLLLG